MSDLEQQIGDALIDGKITDVDAEAMRAFRDFLVDTPPALTSLPGEEWPAQFADRAAFEAWRVKWLPYLVGLAEGPSTTEEWPGYRALLRDEKS